MRIRSADARAARQQADWIVRLEPWRSLGYEKQRLGAWLARQAREGHVRTAMRDDVTLGLAVAQPDFLLGAFIALLAVKPEVAGQGVGRGLVEDAARRAPRRRHWLYTSCDADNRDAACFYRRLGFERVGRLPDLIQVGRTEILLRRVAKRG
jgi:ribosomal protein S18 acetylase RimI-like enzyme